MGKCEMDLDAEMEETTNAAHSHVDIGEMDWPEITQGTMQVDMNTSVENNNQWQSVEQARTISHLRT